jgi:hypothetical protein
MSAPDQMSDAILAEIWATESAKRTVTFESMRRAIATHAYRLGLQRAVEECKTRIEQNAEKMRANYMGDHFEAYMEYQSRMWESAACEAAITRLLTEETAK